MDIHVGCFDAGWIGGTCPRTIFYQTIVRQRAIQWHEGGGVNGTEKLFDPNVCVEDSDGCGA